MKRLIGTLFAVFAGWFAALLCVEMFSIAMIFQGREAFTARTLIEGPLVIGFYMGVFILPVWLLLLVPLYFFVPRDSVLWRWPVCTACGCAAGVLIVATACLCLGQSPFALVGVPYALSAVIGGVTCLAGSLTRERFQAREPAA